MNRLTRKLRATLDAFDHIVGGAHGDEMTNAELVALVLPYFFAALFEFVSPREVFEEIRAEERRYEASRLPLPHAAFAADKRPIR